MKKLILLVIATLLLVALTACSGEDRFVEENLLFDCGAESLDDIQNLTFLHKNATDWVPVTGEEDIARLSHYTYVEDWPDDRLHEVFIWPAVQRMGAEIGGKKYSLYLHEDGRITVKPASESGETGFKTYQADEAYRITPAVFEDWIETYDAP